ncbi:hypothetical protein [Brevibacillus centrosporus]|uniref:hypothetical protein n=1 Tax=Brevibacillus centrosporus TaxID=54910 RepID=UPI002E1C8F73|nr:hypothetical protein [Brevibacillus centrosporus]
MSLKELEMTCEEAAEEIAKEYGLTKKEKDLLAYLLDDEKSKNIGDICKALRTTPRTLLGKTKPSLNRKLDQIPNYEEDEPAVKMTLIVGGKSI